MAEPKKLTELDSVSAVSNDDLLYIVANSSSRSMSRQDFLQIVQTTSGSAGAPTHSFLSDTGMGMYRADTNQLAFSTNGTQRILVDASGAVTLGNSALIADASAAVQTNKVINTDGSASNPSYSFTSDTDTGIYRATGNEISIATGGTKALTIDSNQKTIVSGELVLEEGDSDEISSGGTTVTSSFQRVDTASSASSDDLVNFSGNSLTSGSVLVLATVTAGRDVTVKHGTGVGNNISLHNQSDCVLDDPADRIVFVHDGDNFVEVTRTHKDTPSSSRLTNVQTYTSNDTWSKPANLDYVIVELVGGGGGGGGTEDNGAGEDSHAGGGGAGGYSKKFIKAADLGSSETVTIGAGGSGGTGGGGVGTTPTAGSSGGNTSFGSHCQGNGGSGGSEGEATSGSTRTNGGTGGSATSGDINRQGDFGATGVVIEGNLAGGEHGASTIFGNGGRWNGFTGSGFGSAAGPQASIGDGEDGIAGQGGVVYVYEYTFN